MLSMDTLDIDLLILQEDSFEATYVLREEYFNSIDEATVKSGDVRAEVALTKAASSEYMLSLKVAGTVTVQCDRCLDDMEQHITGDSTYTIRLGNDSAVDDDVIVVDEKDGILPLSWLIYETIALAIPIKHVHAPGKCNDAMTRKLEELSATRSGDDMGDAVDPRWADLEKLKN